MKRLEKQVLLNWARQLSDQELEEEYYKAALDSLGSEAEEMYDRGYDPADIREQEKYEKYKCEKADILESVCVERGIKLWEN